MPYSNVAGFNEVRAIQPGSTRDVRRGEPGGTGASMRSGLFSPEVRAWAIRTPVFPSRFNEVRAIQPGSTGRKARVAQGGVGLQ